MKVFENYSNQSSSQNEYDRLRKLQEGLNRKEIKEDAKKQYSNREIEGMQRNSGKFEDNLKRDGRAQPLRNSDTKFDRVRKNVGKINAVTNVASKINWGEDGLYFVVFAISIVGDVGTAAFGAAEGATGGLVAVFLGAQMEMFVVGISVTIWMLYLMNGHYKKRRAAMKVMVLLGFTFSELMPIVSALPGFIGSFVINYAMVLYERSIEDALVRDKMIGKSFRFISGQNKTGRRNIGAREIIR